jgi:hypothetical protein
VFSQETLGNAAVRAPEGGIDGQLHGFRFDVGNT